MSMAARLMEKLESWLADTAGSRRTDPSQEDLGLLEDARSCAANVDPPHYVGDEKERELELQILMSSWM